MRKLLVLIFSTVLSNSATPTPANALVDGNSVVLVDGNGEILTL